MSDEPLTTPLPEPEPVAQIPPVLPSYPPPPMPGTTSSPAPGSVTTQPAAVPTQTAPEPLVAPTEDPKPPAEKPVDKPAAKPVRNRRVLIWSGFGVAVLVVLGAIAWVAYDRYWADPLSHVVKGHCLADLPVVTDGQEVDVDPPRVVPCEDPAATYVVEGNIKDLTEAQSQDPDVCADFDDATFVYRSVPPGGSGYVLCLRLLNRN